MLRRHRPDTPRTLPLTPAGAIFGIGHVGLELARILARHDLHLHLIDSRPDMLTPQRLTVLAEPVARIHTHHTPLLPEQVLEHLPHGTHILITTHDHAEDAALCDAALRTPHLATIGLIGSTAKWARFRTRLTTEGGHHPTTLNRIKTPIGHPHITGKHPATIALATDLHPTLTHTHTPTNRPVRTPNEMISKVVGLLRD